MSKIPNLKSFVERIFNLNTGYVDIFGTHIPGIGGTSTAGRSGTSTGAAVVHDLRIATAQFAELVVARGSQEEIAALAQAIEGHLLVMQSTANIAGEQCYKLIDELHALAKAI